MRTARNTATLAVLLVMASGIVLVVALPNTTLNWLRSEYRWLGQSVSWVEALWPGWDAVHILMFAIFGALARLAFPKLSMSKLLIGITTFSAASEVLQFWASGRRPSTSDFAQDVLGGLGGLIFVLILEMIWRQLFLMANHVSIAEATANSTD